MEEQGNKAPQHEAAKDAHYPQEGYERKVIVLKIVNDLN
jgi:hypothetical protein